MPAVSMFEFVLWTLQCMNVCSTRCSNHSNTKEGLTFNLQYSARIHLFLPVCRQLCGTMQRSIVNISLVDGCVVLLSQRPRSLHHLHLRLLPAKSPTSEEESQTNLM